MRSTYNSNDFAKVNNVGLSYDHPEQFLDIEDGWEQCRRLIAVNVTAVTMVTRVVLPQMVQRRKGAVVNISSMSCMFPSPLLSVYAATKSFVDTFSANLALEYGRHGVVVQCVLPGFVVSAMSKIKKASLMSPTPDTFVASALSRLGVDSRTTGEDCGRHMMTNIYNKIIIGFWSHTLMEQAINWLPKAVAERMLYNQLNSTRKRAHKKKAKTQ